MQIALGVCTFYDRGVHFCIKMVHLCHKNIVQMYDIFLCGKGDSHDFIVVLLCNMNPYGLTLTLLRKRPGRILRIPLSPPVRIQVEPLNLYSFLCYFRELKFYNVIKRLVDKYACSFVVTRNCRRI